LSSEIKEVKINYPCSLRWGEAKNAYKVLVRKPLEEQPLGNTKKDLGG
jgi:hypothetical protein